jgi:hypothetical protein
VVESPKRVVLSEGDATPRKEDEDVILSDARTKKGASAWSRAP